LLGKPRDADVRPLFRNGTGSAGRRGNAICPSVAGQLCALMGRATQVALVECCKCWRGRTHTKFLTRAASRWLAGYTSANCKIRKPHAQIANSCQASSMRSARSRPGRPTAPPTKFCLPDTASPALGRSRGADSSFLSRPPQYWSGNGRRSSSPLTAILIWERLRPMSSSSRSLIL